MADIYDSSKYLKAYDTSTGTPGSSFDYTAFLNNTKTLADQTRDVKIPDLNAYLGGLKVPKGTRAATLVGALSKDYSSQATSLKGQAEKAAGAIEMKAAGTASYIQNLEQLQAEQAMSNTSMATQWSQAAKQAEEYVADARLRTTQTLREFDSIYKSITQDRDYAKAHAMQAGVQSVIGSMAEEEEYLRRTAKSPEDLTKQLLQFNQKKRTALGTMQSNIEAAYSQLIEESTTNYMGTRANLIDRMHMYTGYAEQNHINTLLEKAKASEAYSLANAQFMVSIEQMKLAGLSEFAEFAMNTPEFTMELAPVISAMIDAIPQSAPQEYERPGPRVSPWNNMTTPKSHAFRMPDSNVPIYANPR